MLKIITNQFLPKPQTIWRFGIPSVFFSSVLVTVLLIGLRQMGRLQFLELVAYDQMVRVLPSQGTDPRLLVVGVDEQDIQAYQQWPLSDQVIAQVLNNLQRNDPRLIGLDIYRDLPHPPGTERLYQALQADNVVVVKQLPNGGAEGVPAPPNIPADRIGFSDLPIDPDNVVRRTFLYLQSPSGAIQESSFALQLALKYLDRDQSVLQVKPDALAIADTTFPRLQADSGGYQLPPSEALGWQILLKYRGKNVARRVTLEEALENRIDPSWVKDKIVLIGVTAPSNKDTFPTPYSAIATQNFEMAGVILHSQILSQILATVLEEEPLFWFWPQRWEWLWIWLWSMLGGVVAWRSQRLAVLGSIVALLIGGLWVLCFLIFAQSGWIPFVPPLLGLLGTGTCVLAYKTVYQTYHDPLTGLANRRALESQLKKLNRGQTFKQQELVAVLFIDVNRFKTINDGLGHQAGDYLLRKIAQRLQQWLDATKHLGRVGGDEFAIWLKPVNDTQSVRTLAENIQQDLSQPFYWQGQEIHLTVSMGIAFDRTGKNFHGGELLRYADIAMYRAKEIDAGRPQVFEADMDLKAVQRWQLEKDLRLALDKQEFQLYYQPIIFLKTGKIAGFEALVRWNSKSRGFVVPGDFIPVAEETGLIVPLGEWILSEACQQIRQWHEQFPEMPTLMMSVNLSSRQFAQPNLVKQIQGILDESEIASDRLKLEITESMMMNDVEAAIELLNCLKGLGLRLSIDDFGTGYSSLSYLHRFPIDTLKVDKSFVGRMDEAEDGDKYIQIVKTIISLGHNLQLDVIAEGIETQTQANVLSSLGCEYGQGYFFSKPLSQKEAEALLASEQQEQNPQS